MDEFILEPGDLLLRRRGTCLFAITPIGTQTGDGCRTGFYKVQCETCMIVINNGTLDVLEQIEQHVSETSK